jgi:hypothetical protein
MATTSYGSITIVDITDVGEFSVYPQGNKAQTQIYNPDQSGVLAYTPNWAENNNPLIITPTAFYAGKNKTSVATYSWKKYINGTLSQFTANEVVSGTRNEVLTINGNILTVANPIVTYEVTAQYSSPEFGSEPLEAVGRIDFSLISRGSSAKTVKITGDSTFAYDTSGNLKNISPIVLTANYSNVTTVGTGLGWKYKAGNSWLDYPTLGPDGNTNITTGSTSTLKVHDTQESSGSSIFSGDTLTIKFQAKDINSNEVSDIFTITKLRDGGLITSATLTNDNQMLPADNSGNVPAAAFGEATTTKITIYNEQGDVDTSNWNITISGTTGISYKVSKNGEDWYDPDNTDKAYTWVKVIGMTSSVDTGKVSFICEHKTDNTLRLEKQFALVKVKAGQDGHEPEIYDIIADFVAVSKAASNAPTNPGAYSPSDVTFTATKTVGTNITSPWSNGYIRVFADNSIVNTDSNPRGTVSYTFSGANVSIFKAVLYSDNSFTNELASQSVTVVKDGDRGADGKQGLGAINVVINNEHDSISCNSNNVTTTQQSLSITYTGYQGTTPRDTTITAPSLSGITYTSGGTTHTSITGTVTHTAGTATGTITFTIPQGATLAANGSATLTFGVLGQHYDSNGNLVSDSSRTSIEKLFTWSRSASPATPDNPVVIVMEYPEGQLYQNSEGTLHINAILYDGSNPVDVNNVTSYTWTQYDGTRSQTDKYGPLKTGASANNNILTVGANAVDSYASFRVTIEYNNVTYKAFGSLMDKFDPLQITVHSTIGTQIKNGQGFGALFVKVRQDNDIIDEIPLDIEAVTNTSDVSAGATYCILCVKPTDTTGKANTVACTGSATLYKKTGNSWGVAPARECTYTWTYHDVDGEPIATGVTRHPALSGQCVYIDASLINSKITADVTVTKN